MSSSPYLGALLPFGDPAASRALTVGAARDAMAARMIADAAVHGNPHAGAFSDEAQQLLGAATVRRLRARRLNEASARAAIGGYDDVARWGSDAAAKETRGAERLEAAVIKGVRESHSPGAFGYISPEEQRLLRQKSNLESMTQAQLEQTFSSLLRKISGASGNFGADADDDEEVGDGGAAHQLAIAAEVYGGDLPAVFGSGVYADSVGLFKPSASRLKKRLARKQKRLAKAEEKLESLEDAGKKGLKVKYLRLRVKTLEKGVSRIESKLEKLEGAKDSVVKSAKKAKKIARAEVQVVKESVSDDDEDEDDDDDLGDVESDEELIAAVEVFGLRPRRARRIRARSRRLTRRARGARGGRRRRLNRRSRRLRSRLRPGFRRPRRALRLVTTPVATSPAMYPAIQRGYVPVADEAFVDDMPSGEEGYEDDEGYQDDEDRMGLEPDPTDTEKVGRDVLVGFFAERAAAFGANGLDPEDSVTFGDGFFGAMGAWFTDLWQSSSSKVAEGAAKRKAATERARAARQPLTPGVVAARKEWTGLRRARTDAGRSARGSSGAPRIVKRDGWIYTQYPNGSLEIQKAGASKKVLVSSSSTGDQKTWFTAVTKQIGPYPTSTSGLSGHFGSGGPFESVARPSTRKDRFVALAQQFDKALKTWGPSSDGTKELADQAVEAREDAEEDPDALLTDEELADFDDALGFAHSEAEDDSLGGRRRRGARGRRRRRRVRRAARLQRRARRAASRGNEGRARRLRRRRGKRIERWQKRNTHRSEHSSAVG